MAEGQSGVSDAESDIKADIRLALGQMVYLENCPVGYDKERKITYGVKGKADLVGICPMIGHHPPIGRTFCLEIKTAKGRQSADQMQYAAMVKRWGGFYSVVRSVEEALAAVDRCQRGLSE